MITRASGARLDEEYAQALARLVLAGLAAVVCFGAWALERSATGLLTATVVGVYWGFALVWAILVRRWPGVFVPRRLAAIVGDVGMTSFGVYAMGPLGAMFYPLYLWIIVGNGMRFGPRYLYATLAAAMVGFSVVVVFGEFWQHHLALGVSLWLGLILLSLFYVTVIRRLHASNARLAAALARSEAATGAQAQLALENARLLREAQEAAEALRAKNAELDSFVYTVSHDLRSPLVTIRGMAGLLGQGHAESLDDDGRRYVERIEVNAGRMERLLVDLLALAQVGRDSRPPEAIDLARVVEEIAAELAEPLRARGAELRVGTLPEVWAIGVQIQIVIRNLLTNALKYMGDQAEPVIEIGAEPRDGTVECFVRDNGIGIDPAYHAKIFDLFHRLKDVEAEGTGVGLPIVKRIVEAAGGRIWVESEQGRGSTFRFTCPRVPAEVLAQS
jgi:signal transduction histidine kinase